METDPRRPLVAAAANAIEAIPFHLRPTRWDDLDGVIALERHPENAGWIEAWSRQEHAAALFDPAIDHSVLLSREGLVGYAILRGLDRPSVELVRLVVGPKGRGIGSRVLTEIEHHAFEALGAERLWLDVARDNRRARGVYERAGFVREKVLRRALVRREGPVDLVVMAKERP